MAVEISIFKLLAIFSVRILLLFSITTSRASSPTLEDRPGHGWSFRVKSHFDRLKTKLLNVIFFSCTYSFPKFIEQHMATEQYFILRPSYSQCGGGGGVRVCKGGVDCSSSTSHASSRYLSFSHFPPETQQFFCSPLPRPGTEPTTLWAKSLNHFNQRPNPLGHVSLATAE